MAAGRTGWQERDWNRWQERDYTRWQERKQTEKNIKRACEEMTTCVFWVLVTSRPSSEADVVLDKE